MFQINKKLRKLQEFIVLLVKILVKISRMV